MKINMVCSHCRSDQVVRDAWAEWNPETQQWELRNVFDVVYCEVCDGETTLKEVPYE
jgi:hypothetical protein